MKHSANIGEFTEKVRHSVGIIDKVSANIGELTEKVRHSVGIIDET